MSVTNLSFSEDPSLWEKRLSALKCLAASRVNVGLTSSASGRSRFLLAIHENGCPVMRIPAQPVIRPALDSPEAREAMSAAMGEAIAAAFSGSEPAVTAALEKAGEAGVEAIHSYIDAGVPPPNSPVTVSGGWIYNRIAKKGVLVSGKGSNTPLIASGALYNDFDYEVKNRE